MPGAKAKPLVSIVDDDISVREAVEAMMQAVGYRAQAFASAGEFLASAALAETSSLITDVNMPEMSGVELHRHLVGSGYVIPTILMTAYPDDELRVRMVAEGIVCYLTKPFDEEALIRSVRAAVGGS